MARARGASDFSRRLVYLVPGQEVFVALGSSVVMVAGVEPIPDPAALLTKALFCLVLVLFCSAFVVRLDRGHLRLTILCRLSLLRFGCNIDGQPHRRLSPRISARLRGRLTLRHIDRDTHRTALPNCIRGASHRRPALHWLQPCT